MKKITAFLLFIFAFGATAQNFASKSDMVIMDKSGDPFYLIIDKVVQNTVPKYQLKIVGLPATYHEIKLVYLSGNTIVLQEHATLQPFKQYTAFVNWKNAQKTFEWIEVTGIQQSNYGNNVEVILFSNPYNVNCQLCIQPSTPGQHYHADGTIHNNYIGGSGNNHGGQHPPHGNYPPNGSNPNCYNPLPTIQPIMDELNNINFSAKKLDYLKDALANRCITSDQAYEIVESFTFDADRVNAAKYCYDRMTDQIYANKLLDLFPFSGTRDEVRKYFTQ
ncbi:MAG TPA: DUF4476 domain-containing protein [Brumimicrobium sp.]|nr:DUF4476 domain-containing protein [Brumimicrobium sp.]